MRFRFHWSVSLCLALAVPALQAAGTDAPPSAFDGYRRFSPDKVAPWAETNRAVTPPEKAPASGSAQAAPVAAPQPSASAPVSAGHGHPHGAAK